MPELIPAAPGSPEWLAARRTGVTATDIASIMGIGYKSAYWLFWNKMGQVPDDPDNDRRRLGRFNEPYVIERWSEEHPDSLIMAGGLYRSTDRPWQMATLDASVNLSRDGQQVLKGSVPGVLEVKTWADADKPAWSDGPPAAVRAQVLWQMDVMDVAAGHVGVVFLPSGEFRSYTIEHEPTYAGSGWGCNGDTCSLCADLILMRAAGDEFMQRLRLELPAPDPDASAATLAAVKARFAKAPDKQAEVDGDVFETWLQTKNVIAEYEYDQRALEIRLREQAGEASILTVDGQPVARRITGEAQVKAHTRRSDYLKRIVREPVTDEPTNGIGE